MSGDDKILEDLVTKFLSNREVDPDVRRIIHKIMEVEIRNLHSERPRGVIDKVYDAIDAVARYNHAQEKKNNKE